MSTVSEEIGVLDRTSRPPLMGAAAGRYAWAVLGVVFLAGVAATLSQYEVPPLLPLLMQAFRVDLAAASSLMSVFAVTGAVLALPSGYILQRLGARTAGVIGIGTVGLGGVVGALSGSFEMLLVSRAIEGLGLGLIAVVAPTVVALWFPPEARGIPMGIWATWFPVGGVLMFNGAPAVASWGGWRAVWWLGAAFCLVSLVLFQLVVRVPASGADADRKAAAVRRDMSPTLLAPTGRSIWLLAGCFSLFCISQGSLNSFYPTFLVSRQGYSLSAASTLASLQMVAVICGCPIAGIVSDRLGSRKLVFTVALLIIAGTWRFPFVIHGWQIPVLLILNGAISAAVPTTVFAAVPEVMSRPALVGTGMAILMFGQNLGYVVGPAVFSRFVQALGWTGAGYACLPLTLAAAAVGWFVRVR